MKKEKAKLKSIGENKYEIDSTGYPCPYPEVFTRRALEEINSGEILEIKTDNKPSCERVPDTLEEEGHKSLGVKEIGDALWKIRIKKK